MLTKDLGLIDFEKFLKIQDKFWEKRVKDMVPDILLFAQHPLTFSLGARNLDKQLCHFLTAPEEIRALGIKIVKTERGGNVTCHAPGILGIYPVIRVLKPFDGPKLVDWLEEVVTAVLARYRISAYRNANINRGLWVGSQKIASVGINISRLVSRFGINLNVSPRLECFKYINPCGIPGCRITSIEKELGYVPPMTEITKLVRQYSASLLKI